MKIYINDRTAGGLAVSVPCLTCGRMLRMSEGLIDRGGPAFRAYYHKGCRPERGEIGVEVLTQAYGTSTQSVLERWPALPEEDL